MWVSPSDMKGRMAILDLRFSEGDVMSTSRIARWDHAPYNVVAHLLHDDFNHTDEEAHALIFEAVMAGQIELAFAKVQSIDSKEQLVIEMEDSNA